jgi:hypothetical protein
MRPQCKKGDVRNRPHMFSKYVGEFKKLLAPRTGSKKKRLSGKHLVKYIAMT